jgi:hypothetical protein
MLRPYKGKGWDALKRALTSLICSGGFADGSRLALPANRRQDGGATK